MRMGLFLNANYKVGFLLATCELVLSQISIVVEQFDRKYFCNGTSKGKENLDKKRRS